MTNTETPTIEFAPLPDPRGTSSPKWRPIMDQLVARPDEWAKIEANKTSHMPASTRFRKEGFEIASRKQEDGTFDIWARWPKPEAT